MESEPRNPEDDAPVLIAHPVGPDFRAVWVWCDHCQRHHIHGNAPGHRNAHCHDRNSPYSDTGYVLQIGAPIFPQ